MKYLSLFSGIEAATVAWHPLGWEPVAFAEIEPFPSRLLKHHYPTILNLGDVTQITERRIKPLGPIDLVVFGSPCQDLSLAGKRTGFTDDDGNHTRSGLFFHAIRIFKLTNARFALWENVPGAFSSNKGRDFAEVVKHMAGLDDLEPPERGWKKEGCAIGDNGMLEWACLDAQWFGLAQRRKRVFALLDTGDWAGRPPVLLEPQGLRGHSPPRREPGQGITHSVAPSLTRSGRGVERTGDTRGQDPVVVVQQVEVAGTLAANAENCNETDFSVTAFGGNKTSTSIDTAACLSTKPTRQDFATETFIISAGFSAGNSQTSRGIAYEEELSPPLRAANSGTNRVPTALSITGQVTHALLTEGHDASGDGSGSGSGTPIVAFSCKDYGADVGDISPTLRSMNHSGSHRNGGGQVAIIKSEGLTAYSGVLQHERRQIRRLTPLECEKLQGFPENYTRIDPKTPDGPRYKALGNSMAVPVIRYIGEQIALTLLI